MYSLHVPATVHGRVLIDGANTPRGILVGFHGYGQVAEDMLVELQQVPGLETWVKASIQALHPFYTRGDTKVVASWMTRQDRDLAIADNIQYVDAALQKIVEAVPTADRLPLVLAGFSQGTAMAYRAALHHTHPVAGVIALAGDVPPELKSDRHKTWPSVLLGVGHLEEWYTGQKLEDDLLFFQSRNIQHEVVRFTGGHEWTDQFRAAVGRWSAALGRE